MNPWRREQGQKRARRVLRWGRGMIRPEDSWPDFYDDDGEFARLLLRTRTLCSCPMCGNPRRHFGRRTLQELRADDEFEAQVEDWRGE